MHFTKSCHCVRTFNVTSKKTARIPGRQIGISLALQFKKKTNTWQAPKHRPYPTDQTMEHYHPPLVP